jgi:hypothetical protein
VNKLGASSAKGFLKLVPEISPMRSHLLINHKQSIAKTWRFSLCDEAMTLPGEYQGVSEAIWR